MCDTLVALPSATADGSVILAKNSDREPNEAQVLTYVPRARHEPGAVIRCTYVEIPQVAETFACVLSRPFWIWGAEMGANEHGVAIGNEAVFTKEPYGKEAGLIGMDMLRLALERACTARQALDVIVGLLETYGQSGNCGLRHKLYYHNSFLIADPGEAWVLETAGQHWVAERVRDVRTISNGLTVDEPDLASTGLVQAGKGFARRYADPFMTRMDGCRERQRRSTELLAAQKGEITPATMMAALRDHGPRADSDAGWNPGRGWLMDTLCAHASLGPTRPSQSTGSMVAHLRPGLTVAWLTGTSAPCTGVFKPVFLEAAGLPDMGPEPTDSYDAGSLWWTHERLHRSVIRDYPNRMAIYRDERDRLEAEFRRQAAQVADQVHRLGAAERAQALAQCTDSCFRQAAEATAHWTAQVEATPVESRPGLLFSVAWRILDRQARR